MNRINISCRIASTSVALLAGLSAFSLPQAQSPRVAGHVMRMGGSGQIVLKKADGRRIDITGKGSKRILLEVGDDLETRGKAWVLFYSIAARTAIRKPPLPTSTRLSPPADSRRPLSLIFGARPQGEIPASANRIFALNGKLQPFVRIGDEPICFGAVSVSARVRPRVLILTRGGKSQEFTFGQNATLLSNGIVHQMRLEGHKELLDGSARSFEVKVQFSDGTQDEAKFELIDQQSGSESTDVLRRALTRYGRAKFADDDWFFRLLDVTEAYEELGCHPQAAATVLDWWLQEPANESAMFALRGIAAKFELGALEREFRDRVPE